MTDRETKTRVWRFVGSGLSEETG